MSISEEQVKAQVDQMKQDLDEAKQARKRSAFTKVVGTILAIVIMSVFVWSFAEMGLNLFEALGPQEDQEVSGVEKILEDAGYKAEFEQLKMQAKNIARAELNETMNELRNDPQIRAMFDNLMRDVAVPAAQQAIREHQSELAAAFETQSDEWLDELRERVQTNVQGQMEQIVREQGQRLLEETDLSEEETEKIIQSIQASAQQAVQNMIEKRMEDWDTELQAIEQARGTIVAEENMPEDIEQYNPVYVLLKLLGHKLQDLDVKSDADLQDTIRTVSDAAVQ